MPPDRPDLLSLTLPADLYLQVTSEQFADLASANRELRLERTATGKLIVNPPTGWETGERNTSLIGELYLWWRHAGEPGKVFESSTGFTLPNGAIRSPDASWVSDERWDAYDRNSDQSTGAFANVCPDFVVELRSRSDRLKPLQDKMQEYITNGTRLGWLIDPQDHRVEIYRADGSIERCDRPSELYGEAILPDFVLSLARIWRS